jgi:hypothetical protein
VQVLDLVANPYHPIHPFHPRHCHVQIHYLVHHPTRLLMWEMQVPPRLYGETSLRVVQLAEVQTLPLLKLPKEMDKVR